MAENIAETPANMQGVPAWLPKTFVDAVQNCGSELPAQMIAEVGKSLLERWSSPTHTYHNAAYLGRVLTAIDELYNVAHDPDLLRVTIWYAGLLPPAAIKLDAPEPSMQRDNCPEKISTSLRELGIEPEECQRVCDLVFYLTRHFAPKADVDASTLVDACMCDLAATPQEYKRYRQKLREQYGHLSDLQYQRARRRFIKALLKRPSIYLSPAGAQWEPLARQNLEAELVNLNASIEKLDPSVTEADDDVIDDFPAEDLEPTTSTLIIKKIGAQKPKKVDTEKSKTEEASFSKPIGILSEGLEDAAGPNTGSIAPVSAPSPAGADSADSTASAVSAGSAPSAPSAESPSIPRSEGSANDDLGVSSLESEPEDLFATQKEPVRRLSAKELARESAKARKEQREKEAAEAEKDAESKNLDK